MEMGPVFTFDVDPHTPIVPGGAGWPGPPGRMPPRCRACLRWQAADTRHDRRRSKDKHKTYSLIAEQTARLFAIWVLHTSCRRASLASAACKLRARWAVDGRTRVLLTSPLGSAAPWTAPLLLQPFQLKTQGTVPVTV